MGLANIFGTGSSVVMIFPSREAALRELLDCEPERPALECVALHSNEILFPQRIVAGRAKHYQLQLERAWYCVS